MIHIVYFLLLLFCTLTNMIHSMHSEELTRPRKNYSNIGSLSQQLLAENFPPKPAAQPLIKTEPDGKYSNTLSNALSNHLSSSSSSSTWQLLAQTTTRKRKLAQEQSKNGQRQRIDIAKQQSILPSLALMINTQSLSETELLIPSDVEYSTLQPSLRQPPRKKIKINQKNFPDNAYFTITCDHCPNKLQFQTLRRGDLINSFKRHSKNKHQNITEEQTKNYIEKRLQESEQLVEFSIDCPEPECKHIAHNVKKFDLKTNLFNHISKKHAYKKINYPIKSVAVYVEDNWEQMLVPTQKQLKNTNFAIICSFCSNKSMFQTLLKHNLINHFKSHLKRKHPNITEKQTKIYIKKHLQEPKLRIRFSVHCPKPECKHIVHNVTKFDLKRNLSIHISTQHPGNKGNYSIESLATYVEDNCKQTLVPAQEQLKNTKKRKINN